MSAEGIAQDGERGRSRIRPKAAERTPFLPNLQVLRGAAALSVLLYHASVYLKATRGAATPLAVFDARFGMMGVCVFFAISGFLMARLVAADPPGLFLAHRIARILPPYLAVVACFALVFWVAGLGFSVNLLALTLAPTGMRTYPLNVEWTLVFEITFYLGLFVLALFGWARRIEGFALAWLVALAASPLLLPAETRDLLMPPIHLLPFSPANVAFAGGLLLPRLIERGRWPAWLGLVALPLAHASTGVGLDGGRWFGGVAAILLVGTAATIRQVSALDGVGRALIRLGDASYVLYLVHVPTILFGLAFAPRGWHWAPLWAVCVLAPLALSLVLGPWDVRSYRWLKRQIDRVPARTLLAAGLAYLAVFAGAGTYGSAIAALEAGRRGRAEAALDALPAEARRSRESLEAFIRSTGRALPESVRGALDPAAPGSDVVTGWALDPGRPDGELHLGLFCQERRAGLDAPRRRRPDIAGRPEYAVFRSRRIGYRMQTGPDCAGHLPLAVVIDDAGRMAVLPR
ncbi:acyltransferase family protein [uncultured Enterovirga sp.]|uniref:acyltransferase family protein n=1 Tax=uncultured Enterovirga sp. TaxID=2026352 RepID=UPI0035C9A421